jgi:RNA polymerase sigma-70 factor (ECF subfamily)
MFLERSEDVLMARSAEGDDRALDVLFDRLAPSVLSFLRCSQREPERAEQLLQCTFVQLHRLRRAYPRGTSARAWVLGIAANVQQQPARKLRWFPALGARRGRAVSVDAASQKSSESQRERVVREAIAGLQEADRQLLHLHRVEGMSFGEIAQVVGVSEDAIRMRAIGSYRQLRERLLMLVSDGGQS